MMRQRWTLAVFLLSLFFLNSGTPPVVYQYDFEQEKIGSIPHDLFYYFEVLRS